jgi:cell pole-organizing protein PopZ
MSQPNEPSMEEILSSIKRIIAEDTESLAPRRGTPAAEPEDEPDVLELTQPWGEPEALDQPEPESEPIAVEEAPALAQAPVAPQPQPEPPASPVFDTGADALLSATTEAATRHALASLSRMVVKPEDPVAENTLEGLVREMLRPMLKDWLDAHLPGIVQATVEREVARISGRG